MDWDDPACAHFLVPISLIARNVISIYLSVYSCQECYSHFAKGVDRPSVSLSLHNPPPGSLPCCYQTVPLLARLLLLRVWCRLVGLVGRRPPHPHEASIRLARRGHGGGAGVCVRPRHRTGLNRRHLYALTGAKGLLLVLLTHQHLTTGAAAPRRAVQGGAAVMVMGVVFGWSCHECAQCGLHPLQAMTQLLHSTNTDRSRRGVSTSEIDPCLLVWSSGTCRCCASCSTMVMSCVS